MQRYRSDLANGSLSNSEDGMDGNLDRIEQDLEKYTEKRVNELYNQSGLGNSPLPRANGVNEASSGTIKPSLTAQAVMTKPSPYSRGQQKIYNAKKFENTIKNSGKDTSGAYGDDKFQAPPILSPANKTVSGSFRLVLSSQSKRTPYRLTKKQFYNPSSAQGSHLHSDLSFLCGM